MTPLERRALLQIEAATPFEGGPNGGTVVASRPEGGACYFLTNNRCRCHDARPFPCRAFPITVRVGAVAQASVVLSCPGLDLSGMDRWVSPTPPAASPTGLEQELQQVREEYARCEAEGVAEQFRRRTRHIERELRSVGRWISPEDVRDAVRADFPWPREVDFPVGNLSEPDAPLEAVPLFFDERWGRVAVRSHPFGIEFLSLGESGGGQRIGDVLPPLRQAPRVSTEGRRELEGYLHYVLRRDDSVHSAYEAVLEGAREPVTDLVAEDLRRLGAHVLTLAMLRRSLRPSGSQPLGRDDIEGGIRASDMDWLDRPSSYGRL